MNLSKAQFEADSAGSVKIDFSEDYDVSSLKGRSALVTGGSTGIGAGCVVALAEAGVYVTIADVNIEPAEKLVHDLTEKGMRIQFVKTNVTSWSDQLNAFEAAIAFSPAKTIDIVIPCAGTVDTRLADWFAQKPTDENGHLRPPPSNVLDVNFTGVWYTELLALTNFSTHPGDDLSKSKLILYVSSMAGYGSMAANLDYGPTKWGVRGMFRCLKDLPLLLGEGKPQFRVNLIAPSWIRTPMTARIMDRVAALGHKVAEVSDVVRVVMRMCADEGVQGRAAVILPDKTSFDVCDNAAELDSGKELHEARVRNLFGWNPADGAKPKQ